MWSRVLSALSLAFVALGLVVLSLDVVPVEPAVALAVGILLAGVFVGLAAQAIELERQKRLLAELGRAVVAVVHERVAPPAPNLESPPRPHVHRLRLASTERTQGWLRKIHTCADPECAYRVVFEYPDSQE